MLFGKKGFVWIFSAMMIGVVLSLNVILAANPPVSDAKSTNPKNVTTISTKIEFERAVDRRDMPIVIDFWASWCEPCVALKPIVEQMSNKYKGRVAFYYFDVDQFIRDSGKKSGKISELSASLDLERFGIKNFNGIPMMYFIKNGLMVSYQEGALGSKEGIDIAANRDEIQKNLEALLSKK